MLVVTPFVQPAVADNVTISFSDLQMGRDVDIEVYQPTANGTRLVTTVNSTGSLELDSSSDYLLVFKPTVDVWYLNPLNGLEFLRREMDVLLVILMWMVVIVAAGYTVLGRRR